MREPLYKLMRGKVCHCLAPQSVCMARLIELAGGEATIGQLQAQGWRIVPARPSALSAALLAVSGW